MSDSGLPGRCGDGNSRPDRSRSGGIDSSTASAASESGTRCSAAVFILDAGMRHSRDSRSTLSQVAPRAFAESDARDASMSLRLGVVSRARVFEAKPVGDRAGARAERVGDLPLAESLACLPRAVLSCRPHDGVGVAHTVVGVLDEDRRA